MSDHNYPSDWNQRRKRVFDQFDWICQGCDEVVSADSDRELHAHHIRPISEGGSHSLENLLPLCKSCHHEVHKDTNSVDLRPRERYECSHCGIDFLSETAVAGSYCSSFCFYSSKAENFLKQIHSNHSICSTCFADVSGQDVCQNCGNWDFQETHRDELDEPPVDAENLVRHTLQIAYEHIEKYP